MCIRDRFRIPLFVPVAFFQSLNPLSTNKSLLLWDSDPKAKQYAQNAASFSLEYLNHENFYSHFGEYLLPFVMGNMKFVSELFKQSKCVLSRSFKLFPEKKTGSFLDLVLWSFEHTGEDVSRKIKKTRIINLKRSKMKKNTKDRHDNITVSNAVIQCTPHPPPPPR